MCYYQEAERQGEHEYTRSEINTGMGMIITCRKQKQHHDGNENV
jgi:hypothetical protein